MATPLRHKMQHENGYTEAEKELTQLLVIELLAHQFCSSVKWVDTQDVILRDWATERLIEIGPSATLVNMAKKTIKEGYEIHDLALGLRRELLSYKTDADAIYYQKAFEEIGTVASAAPAAIPIPIPAAEPITPQAPSTAPKAVSPTALPAKPIAAVHIIAVLVAVALKRALSDIDTSQTIKTLCGGRSTLQNEIIGDLTKEFVSLPERPEDNAINDLGDILSASGLGTKLGACTNSLIAKLASAKMPAGFNETAIRQYLERRWSFKQDLQDHTLLLAISRPPPSRLGDKSTVHQFLDELAHGVLKSIGIDPSASAFTSDQSSAAMSVQVSSETLDALSEEHRAQDRALLSVYAKRLGHDIHGSENEAKKAKSAISTMQEKMDAWTAEHGEVYEHGIAPKFDATMARRFDSFWNWAIQDLVVLFSSSIHGTPDTFESALAERLPHLPNKVTTQLLDAIRYLLRQTNTLGQSPSREATSEWLGGLQKACESSLARNEPVFKYSISSMVPVLRIDEKGNVSVDQQPRFAKLNSGCLSPPKEIDIATPPSSSQSTDSGPFDSEAIFSCPPDRSMGGAKTMLTSISSDSVAVNDVPYQRAADLYEGTELSWAPELQSKGRNGWCRNDDITTAYLKWFQNASRDGISFHEKAILITGAGRGSIGAEVLWQCLAAGAKVIVATSSYSKETCDYYQSLYRRYGARQSQLVVVPFNGGSRQDTENIIKYVYDEESGGGLGWDLDHIIPFAALGEAGRAVDGIDDKSELAHRVMLTNLVRLLGSIKSSKATRRIRTHPTHVILPLSPNHGSFGQDGLYAESKIALEVLLSKWVSEDWDDYITLCGAVIGWTRGTGLMNNNDVLATGIEEDLGIRTFSAPEMAWHIMGLMDDSIASFCELEPLKADLAGGLSASMSLKPVLEQIQERIDSKSRTMKAIAIENAQETQSVGLVSRKLAKRARIQIQEMPLPDWRDIQSLGETLHGMVDLDSIVVAVGFGEIGPCGSARTRWEAECHDTFSVDGCVELAWVMGLIKYHNGPLKGKDYCGWLDTSSGAPIADLEVKTKYERHIIEHTGIRFIQRQEHDMTSPEQQQTLHEVAIANDTAPFDVSLETAKDLQREHGDKVIITERPDGQLSAIMRAGATLLIPKAAHSRSTIGAQLPAGWDPKAYGIPQDIITQVDPITLYALVATVEAFLSAGITDPYELYDHIHVSELGTAVGASLGGVKSLHEMFKRRYLDRPVQKDILAETFVNTTAAWINMLFLGSSGPIRTPVGACATSLESLDTGYDLIVTGKAKAVLVGGTDALERDTAAEFANMQATVDADKEAAHGRTPKEASRPATTTRAGFVEAEGSGIQLLTTAQLALDMGLPIRAIIAATHTASDKVGRSVPAPGKGVLTMAAERKQDPAFPSPLLEIHYRRQRLSDRLADIEEKRRSELGRLRERVNALEKSNHGDCTLEVTLRMDQTGSIARPDHYAERCRRDIEAEADRAIGEARRTYGNNFWRHDPAISPLRGALATWGLTVDDLDVASLHGTSTSQNDANETAVLQRQLAHLGRARGNVLPCVLQKSLLGHGKGAAGAFAVNGALQMLAAGVVPGSRTADNVDAALAADRDRLFFPRETYRCCGGGGGARDLRAFSVTSFGFGQKGAQVVGVHPKYVLAAAFGAPGPAAEAAYAAYRQRVAERMAAATRRLQESMYGGQGLVQVKEKSHYRDEDLEETLLRR